MKLFSYLVVCGMLANALALSPDELNDLKQRAAKMDTAALHELIALSADADSGISGKELVRYCTLAAGQEDAEAQVFLYKCYATGKHVTADSEMAQMWKDSVLATGNADALFKLGKAMMETDLPSAKAEGKRHCELAATKGCAEAKKWKDEREAAEKAEEERLAAEVEAERQAAAAKAEEERLAAEARAAAERRAAMYSSQIVSGAAAFLPSVNVMSNAGSNALYKKRLNTLLPMIENGASVDVTTIDTKGNTALHYACGIGHLELVRWLLDHGANPNAVTNKGATPLMCASREDIRSLLRQRGAR